MRRQFSTFVFGLGVALWWASICSGPATGQPVDQPTRPDQPQEDGEDVFRIVDPQGEPVVGATVRLIHQTVTHPELVRFKTLHTTTTNDAGQFRLPPGFQVANAQHHEGGISATWVTLPASDGQPARTWLLGTRSGVRSPYWDLVAAIATDQTAFERLVQRDHLSERVPHKYVLPQQDTALRVVDSDGKPAADIEVTPIRLVWLSANTAQQPIFVPPELREDLCHRTNADGEVRFTTIAIDDFAELEFCSQTLGRQRTFTNANYLGEDLKKPIVLFAVGAVRGTVATKTDADRQFVRGQQLLFRTRYEGSGLRFPAGRTITMHGYAEVPVDESGRFEIPAMMCGRLQLIDRCAPDAQRRVVLPSATIVKPGGITEAEPTAIAGVKVRGVLRLWPGGEPVAGAVVTVRHGGNVGLSRSQQVHARTNEDGQFTALVVPGTIGYSPLTEVPGYVSVFAWQQAKKPRTPRTGLAPYGKNVDVPYQAEPFDLPPLDLVPAVTLTGTLVNADGQRVPKCGVYAFPLEGQTNCDFAETDADGKFTFTRIPSTFPPTLFRAGEQHHTQVVKIVSREPLVLQRTEE